MIIILNIRGEEVLAYSMTSAGRMIECSAKTLKRLWKNHGVVKPYHHSGKSKNRYNFLTIHEVNIIKRSMRDYNKLMYSNGRTQALNNQLNALHDYYNGARSDLPATAVGDDDEENTY